MTNTGTRGSEMRSLRAAAVVLALMVPRVSALRLQQLQPPGGKYAPCDGAKEHTCPGLQPDQPGLCCNKATFACGARLDTGAPRCVLCPQTCIFLCKPVSKWLDASPCRGREHVGVSKM